MPSTNLNPQQIPDRLATLPVTASPIASDKVAILSGGAEKTVTLENIGTLLGTGGGAPGGGTSGFDNITSVTYDITGRLETLTAEGETYTFLYATNGDVSKIQNPVYEWTITRDSQRNLVSITKVTRDYTDPVVSVVSYGTPGEASVTITWTTDEVSSSQVEYGTSIAYGTLTTLDPTMVTSHSVTITGLTLNTLYYFRVRSADPTGNETIGDGYTFTTLEDNYIYYLGSTLLKRVRLGDMSTNGSVSLAGDSCVIFAAVGQYGYAVNATDQTIDKYDLVSLAKVASRATVHPVQSMCTDGTDLFYTMSNGTLGWVAKITLSTFTDYGNSGGVFNIGGAMTTDGTYVYYCRISGTTDVRKALKSTLAEDPVGITCSPTTNGLANAVTSGGFLYVPLSTNSIKKINTATWTNVGDVTVGSTPRAMVESSGYLYVCNYSSSTVSKVRVSDFTEIGTISITNPHSIKAFGGYLYVPSVTDMTLKKISEASFTVSATVSIGEDPKGLFII